MTVSTYPQGVGSQVTLAAADTVITVVGSAVAHAVNLGNTGILAGAGATGVIFEVNYTSGAADTAFTVDFAGSTDGGTNYYVMDGYGITITAAPPDSQILRFFVPALFGETHIRCRVYATSETDPDGLYGLKARLTGITKSISGGIGS